MAGSELTNRSGHLAIRTFALESVPDHGGGNANEPTWSMSTGIFWLKTTLTLKGANAFTTLIKDISTLYRIALASAQKQYQGFCSQKKKVILK